MGTLGLNISFPVKQADAMLDCPRLLGHHKALLCFRLHNFINHKDQSDQCIRSRERTPFAELPADDDGEAGDDDTGFLYVVRITYSV